jgi:hypothetical protein
MMPIGIVKSLMMILWFSCRAQKRIANSSIIVFFSVDEYPFEDVFWAQEGSLVDVL